jgi:membrane associated rhomboid family serine protease
VKSAQDAMTALARWLSVRGGFQPLGQLLPAGRLPSTQGLFDACLGRWEDGDLRVHALLADQGGGAEWVVQRAESLRGALRTAEGMVPGRLKAGVWLIVADAVRAADLRAPLLEFEDGHFLSKTLVGRGLLCVETGQGEFSGRIGSLPAPADLAAVLVDPGADPGMDAAERVRLGRESDALRHSREEHTAARMLQPGPAPLTWVLMGLNIGVYALQLIYANVLLQRGVSADVADSTAMLSLGANEPGLTLAAGQYWRVLASAFLHGPWWHLGMNMYALFLVGGVLERLIGPWRMAGLYLLSALAAGSLSVATASAGSYSVGASGAIMGLIGVLLAPRFKRDPRFPEALAGRLFRWLARPVLFIFILGLAMHLWDDQLHLDNAAHLGGLLAGFAIGYLWPSFLVRPTRVRA